MNQRIFATAAAVGLSALLVGGAARAQTPAGGEAGAKPAAKGAKRAGQARGNNPLMAAIQAMNLSDDQKAKAMPLVEKMREDIKGLKDLAPQQRRTKMAEINQKLMTDLGAILTPAQMTTFRTEMAKNQIVRTIEPLNLTAEQKTKTDPIVSDAAAQMGKLEGDASTDRKGKAQKTMAIRTDMFAKMRPLLTAEQQTKLDELAKARTGRGQAAGKNKAKNNGGATADL